MRSEISRKSSSSFLFLLAGLLMLFSPSVSKAQNNSAGCKSVWRWVEGEEYNGATKQYEHKQVLRLVTECPPIPANTNSTIPGSRNSNSDSTKKPKEPRITPRKTGSSTKLKIGTYKFNAITERFGERITFKINIERVGANGEVKARMYKGDAEGELKGRVDSSGQLRLQGSLIHVWKGLGKGESIFKLQATVEDDTLINGSYREEWGDKEWGGTFDKGVLEQEL